MMENFKRTIEIKTTEGRIYKETCFTKEYFRFLIASVKRNGDKVITIY